MKRIILVLLSLVMLAACQPTPETDAVRQKNQDAMIEMARGEGTDTVENQNPTESEKELTTLDYRAMYGIPEHLSEEFSGLSDKVTIIVDADINVPDQPLPIVRTVPKDFSQEQVYDLWNRLVGDREMILDQDVVSKEVIAREIEFWMQIQSGEIVNDMYTPEEAAEQIRALQERYQNAPDDVPILYSDGTLVTVDVKDANGNVIAHRTELNAYEPGYGLSFHVSNSNDNTETIYDSDGAFMVTRGGFFSYSTTDRPHVSNAANDPEFMLKPGDPIPEEANDYIHTTPTEIQARANALLEQMGLSDQFGIFEIRLIPDKRWAGIVEGLGHTYKLLGYGYQITYTRLVNGVPVCAKNGLGGKLFWYEEKMAPQWIYETMVAFFDDSEDVAFDWGAPIETLEVIEPNCRLLPFSEIQSEMENKLPMLLEKSINRYEHCEARVQRIELGLWRIREKNNIDAGLLVPVYCFYLDLTYRDSDGDDSRDTDILIINAVDGTVIDPYNGY
ncbi:MAG: membrane lipoprotein lipid attachment site-containing protein [Clostridia bacterium]|nr:membrane lipoprotein lipid attachment site-containing protein [Clostridia bacterium]